MPNGSTFPVKCIQEVPGRPCYTVSPPHAKKEDITKFDAVNSNHGHGPQVWVGLKGKWGWFFSLEEFEKHFENLEPANAS